MIDIDYDYNNGQPTLVWVQSPHQGSWVRHPCHHPGLLVTEEEEEEEEVVEEGEEEAGEKEEGEEEVEQRGGKDWVRGRGHAGVPVGATAEHLSRTHLLPSAREDTPPVAQTRRGTVFPAQGAVADTTGPLTRVSSTFTNVIAVVVPSISSSTTLTATCSFTASPFPFSAILNTKRSH